MNKITAAEIIALNQKAIKEIEDGYTEDDKVQIGHLDVINARSRTLRFNRYLMSRYINSNRRLTKEIISNLGFRLDKSNILADKLGYPMFKVSEFLSNEQRKVVESRAEWNQQNQGIKRSLYQIAELQERIECVTIPQSTKLKCFHEFGDLELLDGLMGRVGHMRLVRHFEWKEMLTILKPLILEYATRTVDSPEQARKGLEFVFQASMLNRIETDFIDAIVNRKDVPIEAAFDNFFTSNQVAINEIMVKYPPLYAFKIFNPESEWFKLRVKFVTKRLNSITGTN